MGKVFILLGIHVITSRRVQRRRGGRDGSKHVNGKINCQLQKFTPLGLISVSDRTVFCTARGGRKTTGSNAPGAFLVFTPQSGRGLVIPLFFRVFFSWSLAPDFRFSLGQRHTRRVFRYTAKGLHLE